MLKHLIYGSESSFEYGPNWDFPPRPDDGSIKIKVPKTILNSMEVIPVKNVDEVLKVALTKPLKRVEWVEVDQISKKTKNKTKEEISRPN